MFSTVVYANIPWWKYNKPMQSVTHLRSLTQKKGLVYGSTLKTTLQRLLHLAFMGYCLKFFQPCQGNNPPKSSKITKKNGRPLFLWPTDLPVEQSAAARPRAAGSCPRRLRLSHPEAVPPSQWCQSPKHSDHKISTGKPQLEHISEPVWTKVSKSLWH